MNMLHGVSIVIEVLVAFLGILIAIAKKKSFGWLIAATFVVYVFYDLAYYVPNVNVPSNILYGLFFFATLSIFWAVFEIYKQS